jgi:hypothetical protein
MYAHRYFSALSLSSGLTSLSVTTASFMFSCFNNWVLYFSQFDAEAPDFYLLVDSPQEFNIAVRLPPG